MNDNVLYHSLLGLATRNGFLGGTCPRCRLHVQVTSPKRTSGPRRYAVVSTPTCDLNRTGCSSGITCEMAILQQLFRSNRAMGDASFSPLAALHREPAARFQAAGRSELLLSANDTGSIRQKTPRPRRTRDVYFHILRRAR